MNAIISKCLRYGVSLPKRAVINCNWAVINTSLTFDSVNCCTANCNSVDCVMSFSALHAHHSDMSVAHGMTPDIIFFQFELNFSGTVMSKCCVGSHLLFWRETIPAWEGGVCMISISLANFILSAWKLKYLGYEEMGSGLEHWGIE